MDRGIQLALALGYHRANLYLWPITEHGVVRVVGGYLEHGPHVHADQITTVVCRHMLSKCGVFDELDVMRLVEDYGFSYMPAGVWPTAVTPSVRATALCS